jgi:cytochrome c oxidase subunit IV
MDQSMHQTGAPVATEQAKPQPRYMLVWGVLAVLMLTKYVLVKFFALPAMFVIPLLCVIAVWKAGLVALYYMHLRFEPRRLLLLALVPLPLAIILVLTVLMEF